MKFRKSIAAAALVSGSLGVAPSIAPADQVMMITEGRSINWRDANYPAGHEMRSMDSPHERYPKKAEDDSSLPPGIPGVTEENAVGVSGEGAEMVEQALAAHGYNPGSVDGFVDLDTRHAIREFQRDNALVVTGNIDSDTAMILGIPVAESA